MNKTKNTKVIILAAGLGTRLRPYTDKTPKCMVYLDGKPLIERQIDVLRKVGFENINIVAGYKKEELNKLGENIIVNERYQETNMLWSLYTAKEHIHGDILITYGDILYTCRTVEDLTTNDYNFVVGFDKNWENYWKSRMDDPINDLESFRMDKHNYIQEIGKKDKMLNEIQGQYMGLTFVNEQYSEKFRQLLIDTCENNKVMNGRYAEKAYMTDFLNTLAINKEGLKGHPVEDPWIEIDTVDDLNSHITIGRLDMINSINNTFKPMRYI